MKENKPQMQVQRIQSNILRNRDSPSYFLVRLLKKKKQR